MYSTVPNLIFGFHGCDQSIADTVIAKQTKLTQSENDYDWLGHGVYFWENDPDRALEYAKYIKNSNRKVNSKIEKPAVVGAIIDPGHCLNLLEYKNLKIVEAAYHSFLELYEKAHGNLDDLPKNYNPIKDEGDLLLRHLDLAVIETLHGLNEKHDDKRQYDSVRAVFLEGKELYANSGFRAKNHIQVCIRNPNCIKGYFHPRDFDKKFPSP
ncbi:MAG: hypothetical protein ABUK01_14835 [Leptospirales bacterium]